MVRKNDRFSYAWITEFGVAAPDATNAFQNLEDRARKLQRTHRELGGTGVEYDHCLMATMGNTDIVEIAYFNHIYHLLEIAESSVRSSRRSIGVRYLTRAETATITTAGDHYRIHHLDRLLKKDADQPPLLAILYLRLSAAAKLCVPEDRSEPLHKTSATLLDTFIGRFFQPNAPVWQLYKSICSATLNEVNTDPSCESLHIAPLIGLDSVDVVLVVRAVRLEQIAAIALAIKHQRLGFVWPATREGKYETWTADMSAFLRTPDDISTEWNSSPLFKEVRTIWGLPLRPTGSEAAKRWRFDKSRYWDLPAAKAAIPASRIRVAPDRLEETFEPIGLAKSICDYQTDEIQSNERRTFVLLGEFDNLSLPSANSMTRELTTTDIRYHFQHFMGTNPEESAIKEGIWPSSEIAIRITIPEDVELPTFSLMRRFIGRFRRKRSADLERFASELSLTERWLESAKELGLPYSTTNLVVNIIHSFMVFLEKDPERFSDLLPALLHLLETTESYPTPPQPDLIWLVSTLNELFNLLARQFWPLQPQGFTLGLEGNVGYRPAGDAFMAYAKTLAADILPDHQILFLDHAGGGLTCKYGPFKYITLRTSLFTLHYPMTWLVSSELAHCRLRSTVVGALPDKCKHYIYSIFNLLGQSVDSSDPISVALEKLNEMIYSSNDSGMNSIFGDTLRVSLTTPIADLFLWRSVTRGREPAADGLKRFWFIHGPGLISKIRNTYGRRSTSIPAINQAILRVFFVTYLMHSTFSGTQIDKSWASRLLLLLERLQDREFRLGDYPSTQKLTYQDQAYVYLQCMRIDLRIPETKWATATGGLRDSFQNIYNNAPDLVEFTTIWLNMTQSLLDKWLLREYHESPVTDLFCDYLLQLTEDWSTSDPWPPFIDRHVVQTKDVNGLISNISAPRPRLREDNPSGGFISLRGGVFVKSLDNSLHGQRDYHRKTGQLLKRLADCTRPIRFRQLRKNIPF